MFNPVIYSGQVYAYSVNGNICVDRASDDIFIETEFNKFKIKDFGELISKADEWFVFESYTDGCKALAPLKRESSNLYKIWERLDELADEFERIDHFLKMDERD